jgi:hypothetical protein
MQLFILCIYFLFLISTLHVSGSHKPIIRGITSCFLVYNHFFNVVFIYVAQLRVHVDRSVVVVSLYYQYSETTMTERSTGSRS